MIKLIRNLRFSTLITLLVAVGGCASSKGALDSSRKDDAPLEFHAILAFEHGTPLRSKELFSKQFVGSITDLASTRRVGHFLVGILPKLDTENEVALSQASLVNLNGEVEWAIPLTAKLKGLAISDDGGLSVLATGPAAAAKGELSAFDLKGKPLWKTEIECKPRILNLAHKILCFSEESASLAKSRRSDKPWLQTLDFDGKKLASFATGSSAEAILTKVAGADAGVGIGFAGGGLRVLDGDLKPVWATTLKGEVVDFAITSKLEAWVLYRQTAGAKSGSLKLSYLNSAGKPAAEFSVPYSAVQVELAPDSPNSESPKSVWVYGNGPMGQSLGQYVVDAGKIAAKWQVTDRRYADFSSPLGVVNDTAFAGFEEGKGIPRHTHLLAWNADGKVIWDLPFKTDEGAYLFSAQGLVPPTAQSDSVSAVNPSGAQEKPRSIVAIGTDRSILSVYELDQN